MVGSSIYAGNGLLASGSRVLHLLLMILIVLLILPAGILSRRIMIRIRSISRKT
jgi:hypothetical protein